MTGGKIDFFASRAALAVRVGCDVRFECQTPTTVVLEVKPIPDPERPAFEERLEFDPPLRPEEFNDGYGNVAHRVTLTPGRNRIRHDALMATPPSSDRAGAIGPAIAVPELPLDLLRYTLPSRYCDSDKLLDFAWRQFGQIPNGPERVMAICDWIHNHIEYRFGSGRPDISASEIIARGFGVCRDFAHCMVALSRTFNLPARYVTGHLPDIGYRDPGTPMDFHAYAEVYLGSEWRTFDARFNVPRIGRIKIAHGLDAVDCAFATIYGTAPMTNFEVWAYQVDPREVSLDDPVDLSKRLDGVEEVRSPILAISG